MKRLCIVFSKPEMVKLLVDSGFFDRVFDVFKIDVFLPSGTKRFLKHDNLRWFEFDPNDTAGRLKSGFFSKIIYLVRLLSYNSSFYPSFGHSFACRHEILEDAVGSGSVFAIIRVKIIFVLVWLCSQLRFLRLLLPRLQLLNHRRSTILETDVEFYDFVLTGSIGFGGDLFLIDELRSKSNLLGCLVKSWDNSSNKGCGFNIFDVVFSWSEHMSEELVNFLDVDRNKIIEVGAPHWATYYDVLSIDNRLLERQFDWYESVAAGDRDLIYFPSPTMKMFRENVSVLSFLCCELDKLYGTDSPIILFRPHPGYWEKGKIEWTIAHNRELDEFKKLANKYSFLEIDYPKIQDQGAFVEMAPSSHQYLASIFRLASCMVSNYSTQAVEAALLGLPTINISYGQYKGTSLPNYFVNGFAHFNRVLNYDFVVSAYTPTALLEAVLFSMKEKRRISPSVVESESSLGVKSHNELSKKICELVN